MHRIQVFVFCAGMLASILVTDAAEASVAISADPTSNMSCSSGVCSPTAKKAVLNVTDLTNMLASEDVKIVTGAGAVTITIFAPFSWTSAHRLTLNAYESVSFRAPVTVAGTGAVTIVTNDGGTGGDLIFFPGAKLDFWDTSSSLVINDNSYKLAGDVRTLAVDIKANPAAYYALSRDVDVTEHGSYSGSPIRASFSGTFDGMGHTIDHLSIDGLCRDDGCGLFRFTYYGAVLRDINLANVHMTIRSPTGSGGALVGNSNGDIVNASADGVISGGQFAGGLAAEIIGSAQNCSANVTIYSGHGSHRMWGAAGGLTAYADTEIRRSHATGAVYGGSYAFIGGLVGAANASISESYATGDVVGSGEAVVGGLLGRLVVGSNTTIQSSYSLGSVSSSPSAYLGGFVGEVKGADEAVVSASYSTGAVSLGARAIQNTIHTSYVGGFFGNDKSHHQDEVAVYWDLETSGQNQACGYGMCSGIVGLSDAQLKSALPAGFDPAIWGQNPSINNGYPYLLANPPPQ